MNTSGSMRGVREGPVWKRADSRLFILFIAFVLFLCVIRTIFYVFRKENHGGTCSRPGFGCVCVSCRTVCDAIRGVLLYDYFWYTSG